MKRRLCCLFLLAFLLAGCGEAAPPETSSAPTSGQAVCLPQAPADAVARSLLCHQEFQDLSTGTQESWDFVYENGSLVRCSQLRNGLQTQLTVTHWPDGSIHTVTGVSQGKSCFFVEFYWDESGRLLACSGWRTHEANTFRRAYTYDEYGNKTSQSLYVNGQLESAYVWQHRYEADTGVPMMSACKENGVEIYQVVPTFEDGRLNGHIRYETDKLAIVTQLNEFNRPVHVGYYTRVTHSQLLLQQGFDYTYTGEAGQPAAELVTFGGAFNRECHFTYDEAGNVIRKDYRNEAGQVFRILSMDYQTQPITQRDLVILEATLQLLQELL